MHGKDNDFVCGQSWRILTAACNPFTSGMLRSKATSSGWSSRTKSIASRPFSASAQTVRTPLCPRRRLLTPLRKSSWSSAMTIRKPGLARTAEFNATSLLRQALHTNRGRPLREARPFPTVPPNAGWRSLPATSPVQPQWQCGVNQWASPASQILQIAYAR